MSFTWLLTLAAALVSSLGVLGVAVAAVARKAAVRNACFRLGMLGLTLGGLTLMAGAAAGRLDSGVLFGGFLMVLVGTGSNLRPISKTRPSDRCAP